MLRSTDIEDIFIKEDYLNLFNSAFNEYSKNNWDTHY